LIIQARQLRLARTQAFFSSQGELVRMLLDHPATLVPHFGGTADLVAGQKHVVMTWRFRHTLLGYLIGEQRGPGLHNFLVTLFRSVEAREWWEQAGPYWERENRSKKEQEFNAIVNAAYSDALQLTNP
jgi:hypothetical protein